MGGQRDCDKYFIKSCELESENARLKEENREMVKRLELFCDKICDLDKASKAHCKENLCLIHESLAIAKRGDGE